MHCNVFTKQPQIMYDIPMAKHNQDTLFKRIGTNKLMIVESCEGSC